MAASTPEALDPLFAKALNAGDLDALVSLYEPNASLMPEPGTVVAGTEAIRAALARFIAAKPSITLSPKTLAQTGELALVTAKWDLDMIGPDGKPRQVSGQSVEVMRRQSDGSWRFVIDFPFGVGVG